MVILVTGGAGYIGSHTVRSLLKKGYNPVVIDNLVYGHSKFVKEILKVPLIEGDISDKNLLENILNGKHQLLKKKLQLLFIRCLCICWGKCSESF